MDDVEKRQKQSNLGVLIFIIATIAGGVTVSKYLNVGDDDAGAAYVIMFYAFSFIMLHLISRNTRRVVFFMSSSISIGTLIYVAMTAHGSEQQNVYKMLFVTIVIAVIVFITQIYNKVKIDKIETQS